MPKNTTQIKDQILLALLPEVPFDGWGWDGVVAVTEKAGQKPDMAAALFPAKMEDVLKHFADWLDREMLKGLKGVDMESLRVRDRIRLAVWTRFEIMQQHREAEKLALSFWSLPSRSIGAAKVLWRTADRIWDWAGDTATDYNHYTKRGLLSGVISSTALCWVSDEEEDMAVTSAFLDRRIENVMQFGRVLGKIRKAS